MFLFLFLLKFFIFIFIFIFIFLLQSKADVRAKSHTRAAISVWAQNACTNSIANLLARLRQRQRRPLRPERLSALAHCCSDRLHPRLQTAAAGKLPPASPLLHELVCPLGCLVHGSLGQGLLASNRAFV